MGYLPTATEEMGEYNVEVRRESFYLFGEPDYPSDGHTFPPRHSIIVYEHHDERPVTGGTIEVLIEDIPKIRAALELVERVHGGEKGL